MEGKKKIQKKVLQNQEILYKVEITVGKRGIQKNCQHLNMKNVYKYAKKKKIII